MKVTGTCHCRQISYEAEIDPELVGICHCDDCQMLTGSAYRVSVPVLAANFRLVTGTPKSYVKVADSGNRRRHSFCPRCGTPVSACADVDDPPSYSLRVGCLRERAELPPQRRIWCKSALPWCADISSLAGSDRQ